MKAAWARLTIFITPKMMARPEDIKAYTPPIKRPEINIPIISTLDHSLLKQLF